MSKARVMRVGQARSAESPRSKGSSDYWRLRNRTELERAVSPEVKRAVDKSIARNREALQELEKH